MTRLQCLPPLADPDQGATSAEAKGAALTRQPNYGCGDCRKRGHNLLPSPTGTYGCGDSSDTWGMRSIRAVSTRWRLASISATASSCANVASRASMAAHSCGC